ncbi:MAG: heavy-metal-associated domain-containing protein [Chloroflexi bacterium]|nr:heavy-metal-associated domain-containing protein [Chloroflexota bacterium]
MRTTLYAPDISCEHCIATIERTTNALPGARFLTGDIEGRRFDVEVESGTVLDALASALAGEGYPLADGASADAAPAGGVPLLTVERAAPAGPPAYTVTRTDVGADVNYRCPCGCTAGFALDRGQPEQAAESCCCGRQLLVGARASERLHAALGVDTYAFDVQTLTMPWGQPLEAALAVPAQPAH